MNKSIYSQPSPPQQDSSGSTLTGTQESTNNKNTFQSDINTPKYTKGWQTKITDYSQHVNFMGLPVGLLYLQVVVHFDWSLKYLLDQ